MNSKDSDSFTGKGPFRSRRKLWTSLVILVVVAAGGWYYWDSSRQQEAADQPLIATV